MKALQAEIGAKASECEGVARILAVPSGDKPGEPREGDPGPVQARPLVMRAYVANANHDRFS